MNSLLPSVLLCALALFADVARGQGPETDTPVTIRFGGDCLLAGFYEAAAADSPELAFAGFDLFRTDDLSLLNLESCVTTRGEPRSKPYTFRTHPRFLSVLRDAGVDLVNIANNHVFDYGEPGFFDTIAALDSTGIPYIGAGIDEGRAHTPFVAVLHGRRFAFLGYYRGEEAPPARGNLPGVAERSLRLIGRDIRDARTRLRADHVIVSLHWGVEKAETPERWQRRVAHAIIDAGADVIIGHHPHVLQGIERYRKGLIAYSLGNLIFGGNSRENYDTAVLELTWSSGRMAYTVLPVRVTGYRAAALRGREGDGVREHVQALSRILRQSTIQRKGHE
jgi:poly-gamma-glutamate capsule biosynthesis protein CapA/YwtB (metallophosphatase superfamily)